MRRASGKLGATCEVRYDNTGLPLPAEEWFRRCTCSNGCWRCYGLTQMEFTWRPASRGHVREIKNHGPRRGVKPDWGVAT